MKKQLMFHTAPLICQINDNRYSKPVAAYSHQNNMTHIYYQYETTLEQQKYIILPTTHISLIILYNKNTVCHMQLYGMVTQPRTLNLPKYTAFYCVQMHSLHALLLLGRELVISLVDNDRPLQQVQGLNYAAIKKAALSADFNQKVAMLEALFQQVQHIPVQYGILSRILEQVYTVNDNLKVNDLSKQIGYSDRQLYQIFKNNFGIGTKLYCRIARFQNSLEWLSSFNSNVVTVANSLGYYDQAHFMHEFKKLSTLTPMEYQSSRLIANE